MIFFGISPTIWTVSASTILRGFMSISEFQEAAEHNTNLVIEFVVPILHYRLGAGEAKEWVNGGTGWFFEAMNKKWLITAAHVAEDYLASLGNNYMTFIGGSDCHMINISQWEVEAIDSELDYCLIKIPKGFSPSRINKSFYKPQTWPLERAVRGDSTFIVGYPGKLRKGDSTTVDAAIACLSDFVASSTDNLLTIVNEEGARIKIPVAEGITTPEHFGGMSGAPVWKIFPDGGVKLVGIFIQGGGADSPYFCRHIDLLFGTVTKPLS